MNFIYLRRFSTSSIIKLVLDDDVVENILYSLTSMTSLSSTCPISTFSSSLYNS